MPEVYPKTRREFDAMFATNEACMGFIGSLRWPEGFVCPKCGGTKFWITGRSLWHCSACGRQQSPVEGTLLHRTRFPLKTWFDTAWHVCEQKNGMSALGLQRAMGFGSYHTAWEWLHRMRQAMVLPGRDKLTGEVQVDETFIGGVKSGKRGRGAAGKSLVLIAAEIRGASIGRIRLLVIPDAKAATLLDAVFELVEKGSDVVTDGLASYADLPSRGFNHVVSRHTPEVGLNLLPKAHRVASLLKRWILGTHQGSVGKEYLQQYLDEFVFRFNRRTSRSRGLLFYRLLQQAVAHEPVPKNSFTGTLGDLSCHS
jgi:transposase-like protein